MGILHTIRSCFFDPAFYAGMRERSWSEAAKYYLVIAFIIIFAYASPVWGLLLTVKPQLVDSVVAVYPDDLKVTVANGVMSINQPEPFVIPNTFSKDLPENLAVFDTQNDTYTPSALTDAKTIILFKRTFAVAMDSDSGNASLGKQRVFSYGTSTGTSTLMKSQIVGVAEQVKPYVRPLAIIGGAFLFILVILIGGVSMLTFHLVYTLFSALLVFFYFKIRKNGDSYRTAYTTALFASLPIAVISALAGLFGGLPTFVYTLALVLLVVANDLNQKPPAPTPKL